MTGMRRAKIVCTIGPATADAETIEQLIDAGMTVARVNATHATPDELETYVEQITTARTNAAVPVAIMLDLQGPEIRTLELDEPLTVTDGDTLTLRPDASEEEDVIGISAPINGASVDDHILIDDGRIEAVITAIDGDDVAVTVTVGGTIHGRRGVNVPGVDLGLGPLTDLDREMLEAGIACGIDFVAASHIETGEDVQQVRAVIESHEADIPLIAKIERQAAIDHLDAILHESYGVMVARGDLGVDIALESVPTAQKYIIRKAHDAGVPVITATEMLETMIQNRRPTRAEASDVANAILDGTDAVMLSGETAVGNYPIRVVETMDRIIRQVEASDQYDEIMAKLLPRPSGSTTDALARSARDMIPEVGARAIAVASESGYTALEAAKYRPDVPIVVATPDDAIARRLALSWGVTVQNAELAGNSTDTVLEHAVAAARGSGAIDEGDTVITLSGMMRELDDARTANILKVHVVADILATGQGVTAGHGTGTAQDLADAGAGDVALVDEDNDLPDDLEEYAGIVAASRHRETAITQHAREHDIPMIVGATLQDIPHDAVVTVDVERGILYRGTVSHPEYRRD